MTQLLKPRGFRRPYALSLLETNFIFTLSKREEFNIWIQHNNFLQFTSFFNRVFLSFQTDAFLILQNMAYKSYNSLLDQILDLCA